MGLGVGTEAAQARVDVAPAGDADAGDAGAAIEDRGAVWCYRGAMVAITLAIVGVGVRAAADGWLPVGDNGFYALRASDVVSRHPPLLGTASSVAVFTHEGVNHPGPLQFDLLAQPVAVLGIGAGTAVGMAAINAAAVAAIGWLVRRRVGPMAGAVAVLGAGGLAWAMGSALLYDPWGPYAALLPCALFLVAAGLAVGGDPVALPVTVGAGSLVLQVHSSYALLVPGLTLVAVVAAAFWAWRDRADPERQRVARWSGAATVAVAALCWAQPLYDQITGDPGNLTAWLQSADQVDQDRTGLRRAVMPVSGIVGLPPWWLPTGFDQPYPVAEQVGEDTSLVVGLASLALLVGALASTGGRGWRNRDRVAVGAIATALAALLLASATTVVAPYHGVVFPTYVRFLWPVSLAVWLALGLAVAQARSSHGPKVAAAAPQPKAGGERLQSTAGHDGVGEIDTQRPEEAYVVGGAGSGGRLTSQGAPGGADGSSRQRLVGAVDVIGGTGPSSRERAARARWRWFSVGIAAAAVVVVGGAIVPHADHAWPERAIEQENAAAVVEAVLEAVDGRGPVLLDQTMSQASYAYLPLLMAALAEHDVPFLVDDPVLIRQVGSHRAVTAERRPRLTVTILHDPEAELPGAERIFERSALSAAEREELGDLIRQLETAIASGPPLRLSTDAGAVLRLSAPDQLAAFERAAAAGRLSVRQVARMHQIVAFSAGESEISSSVVVGDDLDLVRLARWVELTALSERGVAVFLSD